MSRNYEVPVFFDNYVRNHGARKNHSEEWLKEYVVDKISDNVTTIVDFGCAVGRNFTPFNTQYNNSENIHKPYKFIGFDIHPEEKIQEQKLIDFVYYKYSLEDFMENINDFDIKWEECLVFSHGTLMYFKEKTGVNMFINKLRNKGCKNFVFNEYASISAQQGLSEYALNGGLGYIDLNEENLKLFTPPLGLKINMGEEPFYEFDAHIHLEKK